VLSPRGVILVDDWNDPAIQRATRDALRERGATILWERELPGDHSERTWWNGVGVFYVARAGVAASEGQAALRSPAAAVAATCRRRALRAVAEELRRALASR
jgi:hypothetical protein